MPSKKQNVSLTSYQCLKMLQEPWLISKDKRADILPKCAVQDLEVLIDALDCIYEEGRKQTTKVSAVSYLLRAYNRRKSADCEMRCHIATLIYQVMTLPFTGEPPHGAKMWSKEALINSLADMENVNQKTGAFINKRQEQGGFINNISEKEKTVYNDSSSCTVSGRRMA